MATIAHKHTHKHRKPPSTTGKAPIAFEVPIEIVDHYWSQHYNVNLFVPKGMAREGDAFCYTGFSHNGVEARWKYYPNSHILKINFKLRGGTGDEKGFDLYNFHGMNRAGRGMKIGTVWGVNDGSDKSSIWRILGDVDIVRLTNR